MPPPALLPTIRLMDPHPLLQPAAHPVDLQPLPQPALLPAARRVDPQPLLQPAPLPAPRAVVPQPQPQPAPQPALQPLPQPAAPLYTAPQATPNTVNPVQVMVPAGLYLGHGVMPLPQRLLTKILNLEFVEMQDLLPEAWLTLTDDDAAKCCSTSAAGGRKRRPPVTNIFTWLQGFASMVSALSTKYPGMVPEFLAYQSTIIKCYKDYDGLGWVQYDRAFRRQVAITKNLNWSHINGTLYSLCFAGKAKRSAICVHCLSDNHSSERCPEAPPTSKPGRSHPSPVAEICRLFNASGGLRCHYQKCKYSHKCSVCNQDHPRSSCPTSTQGAKGVKRHHPGEQ